MTRWLSGSQRHRRSLACCAAVCLAAGCTSFSFSSAQRSAPRELTAPELMHTFEAGSFSMGDARGEPHEYPVHAVKLSAFRLDKNEVTMASYLECVDARVCRRTPMLDDASFNAPSQPAVGISFYDARTYCAWVGKRLPTEAEWEYAARSSESRLYPFVGDWNDKRANIRGAADGYVFTSPVGAFGQGCTPEGICDLADNAAEWVADWFSATYYSESPDQDPRGPERSTRQKSVRGGNWNGNAYEARATARQAMDPALVTNSVGFRCAQDAR